MRTVEFKCRHCDQRMILEVERVKHHGRKRRRKLKVHDRTIARWGKRLVRRGGRS